MEAGVFDWMLVRNILSTLLFIIGGGAIAVGALGIVRFPDFYTRLHAAGVTDTAGAELILIGMMLQAPSWLIVAKLAFISFILFLTSPVATHAIANAAYADKVKPLLGPNLEYEPGKAAQSAKAQKVEAQKSGETA